ncbi:hypothetical protein [Actinoplanes sp. NPDC051851]|uniref:hypothetical protein n=1 Tax=Actinoplanes sp. NPDC051851 TaxID=3154753 RepID=UPI00342CE634
MTRSRILPTAALVCAALAALTACSDSGTETAAAPQSPAAAAVSASAAPADANATGDKSLCSAVNTAGSTMKSDITSAIDAKGDVDTAKARTALTEFHTAVTRALVVTGDTDVAHAARAVADEIDKAAKADDPIATAADADFETLSESLTTACKSAGVEINF